MGKEIYTIESAAGNESSLKAFLKGRFHAWQQSYFKDLKFLLVRQGRRLTTVIPYKLAQAGVSAGRLHEMADGLFLVPATFCLEAEAFAAAFQKLCRTFPRIIVHLPFSCPGLAPAGSFTYPFVDMASFHPDQFAAQRPWLARQQKKWTPLDFSLSRLDFKKDKETLDFYFKNALRRFKLSRGQVLEQLKWLKADRKFVYVAVLRHQSEILAAQFLSVNAQGDLSLCLSAFQEKFSRYAPGNALTFKLLCHLKKANSAKRYHFGRIYPGENPSYKLKWCDQSMMTYLYQVGRGSCSPLKR